MLERNISLQEFSDLPSFIVAPPLKLVTAIPSEVSQVLDVEIDDLFEELFEDQDNKYLLPGVGFSVKKQVKLLIDDYREILNKGGVIDDVLPLWLERTREDIELFCYEYPLGMFVFPNRIEVGENKEGGTVFYAPRYRKNLMDTILPQERDGAVVEGIKRTEELFGVIPNNSCALLVSPLGESGLQDDRGSEIEYLDTQIYTYLKDQEGEVQSVTLRTDLSLGECEELILGAPEKRKTIWERAKIVASTPRASVAGSFEEVVELLESLTGRNYQNLYKEIDKWSKSRILDPKIIARMERFETLVLENISDLTPKQTRLLAIELGKTILDIYLVIQDESGDPAGSKYSYFDALSKLQQLPGCNGGGKVTSLPLIFTSFGPRLIKAKMMNERASFCCRCPVCKNETTAEVYNGTIKCPLCGSEASISFY